MGSGPILVRCSLFYYATPSIPQTNSASTLLNKLIKAAADGQGAESEQVTIRLKVEDGTPFGKYIEGECLLTTASMQMAVGEVLAAEVAFEFIGCTTRNGDMSIYMGETGQVQI